jgi:hypothetical protein
MKALLSLILLLATVVVTGCKCDNQDEIDRLTFRFSPGDMPRHKVHGKKVLILDTLRENCSCRHSCNVNSVMFYKVKGIDLNVHTINAVELY